ncbi:TM2 domain-containing protein [Flavobacterium sp.]|uniref:TM2 domain-containing protein n=1 Tax=Flavobacterium sp. TaxID=239 RepID=UPI00262C83AD|nr:TM2 domain-containing protein [Flavobacterium sp.]MDD2986157.1 TM2 domain-containing protein [Flavobacterium sp.]
METSKSNEDWNSPNSQAPVQENKKIMAGVLALLVGGLGVHKFVLGYTNEGIIQIVISIFTCGIGGLIPFIEGIIYLTKSDEEFYQTYQVNKKGWF